VSEALWQVLVVVLLIAVVLEAVALVAVMRQVGGVLLQLNPARVGQIEGGGPEPGTEVEYPGREIGKPALVLFVSHTCGLCKDLIPAIPVVQSHYRELEIVAVVTGGEEGDRLAYAKGIGETARPDLHDLQQRWSVPGTPFAVAIDRDNRVQVSGVANSLDQLEALAETLLADDGAPDTAAREEVESGETAKAAV